MDRQPVDSSNLVSVGYDPTTQILEIEFHSGGTYQYSGVPPYVHEDLMNAPSKGVYFSQNIRNTYSFSRVG